MEIRATEFWMHIFSAHNSLFDTVKFKLQGTHLKVTLKHGWV